jgi:hypothetical protein
MLPAIIDNPTLTKWRNRAPGTLHGEILANLPALLNMALRYDDAVVVTRDQKEELKKLQAEIEVLKLDIEEANLSRCRIWQCGGRR